MQCHTANQVARATTGMLDGIQPPRHGSAPPIGARMKHFSHSKCCCFWMTKTRWKHCPPRLDHCLAVLQPEKHLICHPHIQQCRMPHSTRDFACVSTTHQCAPMECPISALALLRGHPWKRHSIPKDAVSSLATVQSRSNWGQPTARVCLCCSKGPTRVHS